MACLHQASSGCAAPIGCKASQPGPPTGSLSNSQGAGGFSLSSTSGIVVDAIDTVSTSDGSRYHLLDDKTFTVAMTSLGFNYGGPDVAFAMGEQQQQ